ncbi:MAG: tetratricopeptide repeat protein [Proteobacteria bacterium]|nr:tetratricopeptide repeat protein [Pseudomonadota bacterium]
MVRFCQKIAHIVLSVFILVTWGLTSSACGSELAEKYKNTGNRYYSQGKYAQAITEFTKAIDEDPDFMPAYYNRGLAFYDLNLYYKAIVDFDMVIMMHPEDKDSYLIRGLCYSKVNKLKLALLDITKAADLGDMDAIKLLKSGEISQQIEASRSKQKKINAIIDENQKQYNRVVEVANVANEFGGNTLVTTYSKGDPFYDGNEGIFRRLDYYDAAEQLKKTELFHTAVFISDNDTNKTTIWYNDNSTISKKSFTYTGKMLNFTGVHYYDELGNLKKKALLDKHGKEISFKRFP